MSHIEVICVSSVTRSVSPKNMLILSELFQPLEKNKVYTFHCIIYMPLCKLR